MTNNVEVRALSKLIIKPDLHEDWNGDECVFNMQ